MVLLGMVIYNDILHKSESTPTRGIVTDLTFIIIQYLRVSELRKKVAHRRINTTELVYPFLQSRGINIVHECLDYPCPSENFVLQG